MKKVFLVFVAMLVFASCSQDVTVVCDDVQTTNVELRMNPTTTASRDVNRGTVPVWVENIQVTVESPSTDSSVFKEYVLVDDNSGDDSFLIEDIPLGLNNFNASTTSNVTSDHSSSTLRKNQDSDDVIAENVSLNPYVLYDGSNLGYNVTLDDNLVNIPMTTEYGRRISIFKLEPSLEHDYYFSVKTTHNGDVIGDKEVKNGKKVLVYWSGSSSVAGEFQTHIISVYSKNTDILIKEYEVIETIEASTSISSKFTIYADDLINSEQGLDFVWQDWVEVIEEN
jgi:hypothetical protein|tara:strand:- start:11 stop:856 length:846 start_codon:yes stop_codon:yes gene_type:complete